MKVEVRTDTHSALPLMETVLSDGRPLGVEYPQVFGPGSSGRVVVAHEGGEVRSACAILVRELIFPDGLGLPRAIKVGLIGSVSTAAEHRGQGLASSVLDLAERKLREAGCLFSMLWADDAAFYASRGYQPVGLEVDLVLEQAMRLELPAPTRVRSAMVEDFAHLHRLYLTQDRRVVRSATESSELFATPGMQVLVQDPGSGPTAYACLGRGHDLEGVVHEWAGEQRGVLACVRAHMESVGSLYMMASASEGGVSSEIQQLGASASAGVLGLGKILDIPQATALLCQSSSSSLGARQGVNGTTELLNGCLSVQIGSEAWLELLFPAKGRCDQLERLETQLNTTFEGLPWAPFMWGLDSI